jgi:hypothetical protein
MGKGGLVIYLAFMDVPDVLPRVMRVERTLCGNVAACGVIAPHAQQKGSSADLMSV